LVGWMKRYGDILYFIIFGLMLKGWDKKYSTQMLDKLNHKNLGSVWLRVKEGWDSVIQHILIEFIHYGL
jgi:hypothetical protein